MSERQYDNKVLRKGIQVLKALGLPEYVEMTLEDLSTALQIPKGTLIPYLAVLESEQFVERTLDGRWRIAPAVTRFAEGFRRHIAEKRAELSQVEKSHLEG